MAPKKAKVMAPVEKPCDMEKGDSPSDETVVLYQCAVDQKMLAEKSPVFKQQFSERWQKSSDVAPVYLNIEDFSLRAQIAFLGYTYGNALYLADHAKECALTLELYQMADKYLMAQLREDLEQAVDKLKISDTDVFVVMDAVSNRKDLAPVQDLCKKLLRRCAETVHFNHIDVLKLWMENGEKNNDALWMLNQELAILTGTWGTFQFKVENVSQLNENTPVLSPPHIVSNIPWKLVVGRLENFIGCSVICSYAERGNRNWSCKANAEIKILNQKENGSSLARNFSKFCIFSPESRGWGFSQFADWNEVIDPENGFLKDDTIIFEAEVEANAPQGITWDAMELTNEELCDNCHCIPCMDGQPVKEVKKGLRVARKIVSKQVVRKAKPTKVGACSFPINCSDGLHYLHLEQIDTAPMDNVITYSCT